MENLRKLLDIEQAINIDELLLHYKYRKVSGTYKNSNTQSSSILELRVDVDGRRPQQIISGDLFLRFTLDIGIFKHFPFNGLHARISPLSLVLYQKSFIVESVTKTVASNGMMTLTGPIRYYEDPGVTDETIEVEIQRVPFFNPAPGCSVRIYKAGTLKASYCLPKISEYYRIVHLEVDRYSGTSFPPQVDKNLDPSPSDLPTGTINTRQVFQNSGIDLTVQEDDVLSDSESADAGDNWSEAELHQLMEDNFDRFGNYQQWNVYGVVVPRFGDPNYDSGYYGTMFDWGGWQAGDTFLRQGFAIAEEATRGRSSGTLYDNAAKKDRLVLQTFCHELGHAFNLPHSWQRGVNADSASNSFMNYPWGYTGGAGSESAFWSDFRWEFDDPELVWMRHGNRRDVMFGGRDWIGNNLSAFTGPLPEAQEGNLQLQIKGKEIWRSFEPVSLIVQLTNKGPEKIALINRLQPEEQLLNIYIELPDGSHMRFVPPVRRLLAPEQEVVELAPGESIYESISLAYSSAGPVFSKPGAYRVRAFYGEHDGALMSASFRLRIASTYSAAEDEFVHLLSDVRVAKFLYYRGGGKKYADVAEKLEKVCKSHDKTHPELTRRLQLALGHHYARNFKALEIRNGRKRWSTLKADPQKAIAALTQALSPLPGQKETAVDFITYGRTSSRLLDLYESAGNWKGAEKAAEQALKYLSGMDEVKAHTDLLKKRIAKIKKRTGK